MTYNIRNGTILALVLALLLNLIVFFIGRSFLNVPFTVSQFPDPIGIVQIIVMTLASTLGAGIVLWVLQNSQPNFVQIFLWLAAILALISLIPVYTMAIGRGSFFSLGFMHVITASSVVYGLLYFSNCDDCDDA